MVTFLGKDGNFALFSNGPLAVIIDTSLDMVADIDSTEYLSTIKSWTTEGDIHSESTLALATNALTASAEPVVASAKRMYTIPGGVQAEAKKALAWRKEHKRGGTPVGLNTARTLAKGGQIGLEKIRHIAKYFPRHSIHKGSDGWKPGDDKFPSNGRIAWALWGGDAGQRWASTIVERENKKAMAAGAYMLPGYSEHVDLENTEDFKYSPDVSAFKMAHELDMTAGPEFMARIRMDGSGIDRLYKIEIDGSVYVWDDCAWDDLGHVDGDIYTYDSFLDDVYDTVEKDYVLIDPSSAVIISAFLQERPFQPVLLDEIDPKEARLMADGLAEEDFGMIDRVITAAGQVSAPGDGVDTPEERGERAEKQPRDASGKFAKKGAEVVVANDLARGKGKITRIDAKNGTVDVLLRNGKTITVPSDQTTALKDMDGGLPVQDAATPGPLDVSGILGEPRTPINMPKAHLPGTMKPITGQDVSKMMSDWSGFVKDMRASFKKPKTAAVTAAAEEKIQTPEDTDVPAKYLALVSPDDNSAVMDLVAIVPKTATTTEPKVYERKDGKWVENDQIFRDLVSPTPPPVVELEPGEILDDVLKQVDGISPATASAALLAFWDKNIAPVLAAGGLDRNRGNAEELRRYWVKGKGAAKIRWGQPGDWKRCVKYLYKHLGPRAKGYCQLRHKEALGYYTSTHAKKERANG